jgi:hypothetical protein
MESTHTVLRGLLRRWRYLLACLLVLSRDIPQRVISAQVKFLLQFVLISYHSRPDHKFDIQEDAIVTAVKPQILHSFYILSLITLKQIRNIEIGFL